jgi:uncharacterized protein (DUF983 family)
MEMEEETKELRFIHHCTIACKNCEFQQHCDFCGEDFCGCRYSDEDDPLTALSLLYIGILMLYLIVMLVIANLNLSNTLKF